MVFLVVILEIIIMPKPSKKIAIVSNFDAEALLFTEATPIILASEIVPIQKPVITANTIEQ